MTVVLRTVDLTPIQEAIANRDHETFDRIAGELGLALTLKDWVKYATKFDKKYIHSIGNSFFKLAYTTLHDPAGFGVVVWVSLTLFAVRIDDRLVFGMQKGGAVNKPFAKSGWKLGRWFKDPVKNRPTVEAWANDPKREKDSLIIPITKPPEPAPADSRGDALLAAVIANPDDLLARLVYADWLGEQGDVRGELIRVQCDLATNPSEALKEREKNLLASVQKGMTATLDRFAHVKIRRGLVEHVTMFAKELVKHGPDLVTKHPITGVRVLCNGAEEFAQLATLPFLAKIPAIEIESRERKHVVHSRAKMKPSALAKSPLFATTKRLEFSDFADTAKEWAKFFSELEAPALEELVLTRCEITLDVVAVLAQKHVMPKLRSLELSAPPFAKAPVHATRSDLRGRDKIQSVFAKLAKRGLQEVVFSLWHLGDSLLSKCVSEMLKSKALRSIAIDNCSSAGDQTFDALVEGCERLEELRWTGGFTRPMTEDEKARFPKHVRVLAKMK